MDLSPETIKCAVAFRNVAHELSRRLKAEVEPCAELTALTEAIESIPEVVAPKEKTKPVEEGQKTNKEVQDQVVLELITKHGPVSRMWLKTWFGMDSIKDVGDPLDRAIARLVSSDKIEIGSYMFKGSENLIQIAKD